MQICEVQLSTELQQLKWQQHCWIEVIPALRGLEKIWMKNPACSRITFFTAEWLVSQSLLSSSSHLLSKKNCLGQTCHLRRKMNLEEKLQDFIQVWRTEFPLGKTTAQKGFKHETQVNVAAGAIAILMKAYLHQATCHEIEGVVPISGLVWMRLVWFAVVLGCDSFPSWGGISILGQEPKKPNHTCNLQDSPTHTSFFYAGIPNYSVKGIIHFKGNRESAQHKKKKKIWPYNHGILLILSKALARSSYTSICIIQSMDFSIQVSASPEIFLPSHGRSSHIQYTKVHLSEIKQSPNYFPNFYTRVAISL